MSTAERQVLLGRACYLVALYRADKVQREKSHAATRQHILICHDIIKEITP